MKIVKTRWFGTLRSIAVLSVAVLIAGCSGGDGTDDAQGSKSSETTKEQQDDRSGRQGATLVRDTKGKAEIAKNKPDDDDPDADFHTVTDSDEIVELDVPESWDDLSNVGFSSEDDTDTDHGAGISASTDLDAAAENWGVSAATFIATSKPDTQLTSGDFQAVLDQNAYPDDCTDKGVVEYHDHGYSGLLQRWNECGESDTIWLVLAAAADDDSHAVLLTIAGTREDEQALPTVLGSFRVVAPTPLDV